MKGALRDAGKIILTAARANAPVDLGLLKHSLKIRPINAKKLIAIQIFSNSKTLEKKYKKMSEKAAAKGKKIAKRVSFYGAFVEFGTKKMKARNFMRNALDNNKSQCLGIISNKLASEIPKIARSF